LLAKHFKFDSISRCDGKNVKLSFFVCLRNIRQCHSIQNTKLLSHHWSVDQIQLWQQQKLPKSLPKEKFNQVTIEFITSMTT
jgi:hypothetical protein